MKTLKLAIHITLCVAVVLLNIPQTAQAALFTKKAEAAIIATDADAAEVTYVAPQASGGTTLFSTGTGFTSLGNGLLSKLQQVFQPSAVEQAASPVSTAAPVVIDQQVSEDQSGIAVVPLGADKAAIVGAPVVLMGEEKAALTIEEMIPVVPAGEGIVQESAQPAEAAATQDDEEKALFPLLWAGSGAKGGAGAVAGAGFFSTTQGKAIGIGLLVALIAVGIALPLALSSSGGGSGGDASSGDGSVEEHGSGGSGGGDGDTEDDGGDSGNGSAPIPEPLTLILFGTGLVGLFLRKKHS